MRKLLFNLHLYVALIAGVFVVILGLTGSIMAFEPEIDRVLHWKLSYVTPQSHALSLGDIAGIVTRAFPGEPIRVYGIAAAPDRSYQIATKKRSVFVNEYTGEILGTRSGDDWVWRVSEHGSPVAPAPAHPQQSGHGRSRRELRRYRNYVPVTLRPLSLVAAQANPHPMEGLDAAHLVRSSQRRRSVFTLLPARSRDDRRRHGIRQ